MEIVSSFLPSRSVFLQALNTLTVNHTIFVVTAGTSNIIRQSLMSLNVSCADFMSGLVYAAPVRF